MKDSRILDTILEPERCELLESSEGGFELGRRDFFRVLGGGLAVFALLRDAAALQRGSMDAPREIGAWLHIGEDGAITVHTGKVEVGQNIRTSLSQAVADELRVPVESIRLIMGDTGLTPFDMGTFGSRTTPFMSPQLRRAAATARETLLDLAAEEWNAARDSLTIGDGIVAHRPSGRSASYGEITRGRKLTRMVEDSAPVVPADRWKISGGSVAKVNGRSFVTGRHEFPSDIRLPGLLHGKVLRRPAFGAALVSADLSGAERMEGVTVARNGDFVGVAAPNELLAEQALAAIRAEWKAVPQPSSRELFEYLKRNSESGRPAHTAGSVTQGLAQADHTLRQTYTVAYIAHVPLEPRAAVAEWRDERLTVWTGTQRPFGVRSELARALEIPESRVRVIMPDTGSGYGGKHTGDAAVEAARLARVAGRPVKVVWTREEEFTWAYVRPAGVIEVSSGIRNDGVMTVWEFHNYNSGASAIRTLYDIPHQRIEFHPARSPLRQGSYRALAATANHFARETHMDELARVVGVDPLELRLRNLKDPRLRAVLEAAAKTFGWGRDKESENLGFGIAGGFEKGSYVATCAEVSVERESGQVQVRRLVAAFECGAIVNPDHLKSQVEGCIVMGLGGALFEEVAFENGRISNPRFSQYCVPRFSDIPSIEIALLDRRDLPSAGGGETPIVGVAPAIGNAIFDAAGVRLRSLPLLGNGKRIQLT